MARIVLLDAGPYGLAASPPTVPEAVACLAWLRRLDAAGFVVAVPEVTDYEVRRELIRLGAPAKLRRLDALRAALGLAPVTAEAWARAAEFWAVVRRAGMPTADPHALDADAILAGVAATIGGPGDVVTIATRNVGHLARFPGIDARQWGQIAP